MSQLLIGQNYQQQYDVWTKEIEDIASSVSRTKRRKGRAVRKWILVKKGLRKSLKGNHNKKEIEILKRRIKLLDEHIEEEDKVNKANGIRKTVERMEV